ncbi:MAG TPA: histidine phosphatase family protein [Candidatus Dormibacteraeota bacterium]|nr:histidine phosphatase family protein [Candidatus Dormibacteraeota bacterium]
MGEDRRTAGFLRMIAELDARHLVGVADVREVWLIRHADAYRGLEALAEGPIDPPLSERGREQAARLAARLAPVPLHAVWSSELRRARETAEAIARDHGLAVCTDARLREVRTHWDDGHVPERLTPGSYPFPEPEAEVAERMRSVVADVAAALAGIDAPIPRAAVVTHNAAIAVYLSSVLGLRWGQLRMMPQFTSVSVVAIKDDQVVIQSIADATHLSGRQ